MTSPFLNILMAVALVAGGTTYTCGDCHLGSGTPMHCQGMDCQSARPACEDALAGSASSSPRWCEGHESSLGAFTDGSASTPKSGTQAVLAVNIPPAPASLVLPEKAAEGAREERHRGSVFFVLDGSSIPIATGHLLF